MNILDFSKALIEENIKNIPKNAILVDFTMGNGNDTLFLCRQVPEGFVYAFDIQEEALQNTEARLKQNNITNATLILDCHSNILNYLNKIDGGMFNLGYLPGGDKSITTKKETTLKAIKNAISILNPEGMIVINIYPGHEEGDLEGEMILDYLKGLDSMDYDVLLHRLINKISLGAPYIIAVKNRK